MTLTAARISRISFHTDLTRADAPVIPLAVMIEAIVPENARWLGLIGRPSLTRVELDRVNLDTWPQLEAPFGLMAEMFERAWEAGPGRAGTTLSKHFGASAMSVRTTDNPAISQMLKADTASDWALTRHSLMQSLESFEVELLPCLTAEVLQFKTLEPPRIPELQQQFRQGGISRAA